MRHVNVIYYVHIVKGAVLPVLEHVSTECTSHARCVSWSLPVLGRRFRHDRNLTRARLRLSPLVILVFIETFLVTGVVVNGDVSLNDRLIISAEVGRLLDMKKWRVLH